MLLRSILYIIFLPMASLLFSGCGNSDAQRAAQWKQAEKASLAQARELVRSGDIITRTGNDFTSQSLLRFNKKDKTYSHCGIASIENGEIFIYHAVGGETNPDEVLRRDPLSFFVNSTDNSGFGIFRFPFMPQQKANIIAVSHSFYKEKIKFDLAFDLKTDDKMYCSEFVAKTISRALNKPFIFQTDTLAGKIYIAPDNIFLAPGCKEIKRFRYF